MLKNVERGREIERDGYKMHIVLANFTNYTSQRLVNGWLYGAGKENALNMHFYPFATVNLNGLTMMHILP